MSVTRDFAVHRVLLDMACVIVDYPEAVKIRVESDGHAKTTFTVTVHPSDTGKLIGKQGKVARSLRTIIGAVGTKVRWHFAVVIENDHPSVEDFAD
jgi:uncharacterized protein